MPEEQGDGLRSQKESIFSAPEPREYCYLTLACEESEILTQLCCDRVKITAFVSEEILESIIKNN